MKKLIVSLIVSVLAVTASPLASASEHSSTNTAQFAGQSITGTDRGGIDGGTLGTDRGGRPEAASSSPLDSLSHWLQEALGSLTNYQ